MSEDQDDQPKSEGKFGYLKARYQPKREVAEERLVEKGLKKGTGEFRKARAVAARLALEGEFEGEIDALTRAPNRKNFERRLKEEAERIKRFNHTSTVMFLDVNNLKEINDAQGHDKGDELIKKVAEILKAQTRVSDVFSRYGGDEFVVILTETDLLGAQSYWERLNGSFGEAGISIAAGATEIDPNDIEFSVKKADEAMYEAKVISKQQKQNVLIVHAPD